jgi:hypothetical protein
MPTPLECEKILWLLNFHGWIALVRYRVFISLWLIIFHPLLQADFNEQVGIDNVDLTATGMAFYNPDPATPKIITLDYGGALIDFPAGDSKYFYLDANVQLTLQNAVLRNFNLNAVKFAAPSATLLFGENIKIELESDVVIPATGPVWKFIANAEISGFGHSLQLETDNAISLSGAKRLTFSNVILKPKTASAFANLTPDATMVLKNSSLLLSQTNFTFAMGNLEIAEQCKFFTRLGSSFPGGSGLQFEFASTGTFKVTSGATLTIDEDLTLSYNPNFGDDAVDLAGSKRHFLLEDMTAILRLNDSTIIAAAHGLALDRGRLLLTGDCTIYSGSSADKALELGSSLSIEFDSWANLSFVGPVEYKKSLVVQTIDKR